MNSIQTGTSNPQRPEIERDDVAGVDTTRIELTPHGSMAAWIPITLLVAAVGCGASPEATDAIPGNVCGDGVVADSEECDDGNDSEGDECLNNCTWACGDSVPPMDGDGCCPPTGNANNDGDCNPICGNMAVEMGEECDDGNIQVGDDCDDDCQIERTAFRIDSLIFQDPHLFFVSRMGCVDVTYLADTLVETEMTTDDQDDGHVDFSLVTVFRPLDQGAESTPFDIIFANCTDPVATTSCSQPEKSEPILSIATNMTEGTCLQPSPGTTSGYNPPVTHTTAPCYVSDPVELTLAVESVTIPLTHVRFSATYVDSPATGMIDGLLVGFISEAEAAKSTVVAPAFGSLPLTSLLPGGADNCSSVDARDVGPDGVTTGWWMHMNFTATEVPWTM